MIVLKTVKFDFKMSTKIVLMSGLISLACTTRVSEWVLLNAAPEKYSLIYYSNDPFSESEKKRINAAKENFRLSNLTVSAVINKDLKESYYALCHRNKLIAKYRNDDTVRNIASSPLRKKIADKLMEGQLCVFLYLKTGNEAKDRNGFNQLQNAVNASPFKDILSVIQLDRNDEDERIFISLLLNVEDDLIRINEPMLFGIFGKFKALEPLLAGGISESNIKLMIDYLIAECSCLIKDDLPGKDILFSGNWENPKPAMLNALIDKNPLLAQ